MSSGKLKASVSAMLVKPKPCLKHSTWQSMDVQHSLMCKGPSWRRFTQRLGEYGEGYTLQAQKVAKQRISGYIKVQNLLQSV